MRILVQHKPKFTPNWLHKLDIGLILAFPFVATFFSETWHLNYFISTLLFFGIPSIYISLRKPLLIKKTLKFTLIFFAPFTIILDYMAYLDLSWWVPNSAFRFMKNGIPIEDVPWAFLWVYFAVIFWEFFLDHDRNKVKIDAHIRYLITILVSVFVVFISAYWIKPDVLVWNYFYLKLGIVMIIIPLTVVIAKFPWLLRKIMIIGSYFFMLNMLTEFVGLRQYQWEFTGQHYINQFIWMGHRLPLEEIVFYWSLGIPALICWYEFFADDRK